jgi:hypothetical protein
VYKKIFLFFCFLSLEHPLRAQIGHPYNLHGILDNQKVKIQIADNLTQSHDDYYYYEGDFKKIRLLPIEVPSSLKAEVFDIWEQIEQDQIKAYFFVTSFPASMVLKGVWVNPHTRERKDFTFYHVLNMKGMINYKAIQMVLEFNGKYDSESSYYTGYYYYTDDTRTHSISAVLNHQGFKEIIETDQNGFVAFFEPVPNESGSLTLHKMLWQSADGNVSVPVELYF